MSQENRNIILKYLAKKFEQDGRGMAEFDEITNNTGIPSSDVKTTVTQLLRMGYLDESGTLGGATLNPIRYDEIVSSPSEEYPIHAGHTNVTINGDVNQSAIALDGASVNVNVTNLLKQLTGEIEAHPDIHEDDKHHWIKVLKEMSDHPIAVAIMMKILGT